MGWDIPSKSVIRLNGRNTGPTIWDLDAIANQAIDSLGHDTHDQDLADSITACLNKNGVNEMAANLKMGSNKITGLSPGTATTDGVNKSQIDSIQTQVDDNTTAIGEINTSDPNSLISGVTFDGLTQTFTRANGNFTTEFNVLNEIRSNGLIRHISPVLTPGATVPVPVDTANRFALSNDGSGAMAIDLTLPTGDDPELGADYWVEGTIIITNGAAPGSLTINTAAANIIGTPSADIGAKQILSYMVRRTAGDTYNEMYVWTVA